MGWTTKPAATQTWGGGTTSSVTFQRAAIASSAWLTVSPQPEAADTGIDFEARFRDAYPAFTFREDRPVLFQSSLSEGQP